jgi:Uma2 family endonuclease
MATVETPKLTAENLLTMPDDGVERWLIRGELREKYPEEAGATLTVRNRYHCEAASFIATTLCNWLRTRPKPRGSVFTGEAGVRLRGADGTALGVDVVYAPADVVAVQDDDDTTMLSGVPTLCVEILSPNDTFEQIDEKITEYLSAGVPLVWVADPYRRTVTVHRPDAEPALFNRTQAMPEHPAMPGFAPAVIDLFE